MIKQVSIFCWGDNSFSHMRNPAAINPQTTAIQVVGIGGTGFLSNVGVTKRFPILVRRAFRLAGFVLR